MPAAKSSRAPRTYRSSTAAVMNLPIQPSSSTATPNIIITTRAD